MMSAIKLFSESVAQLNKNVGLPTGFENTTLLQKYRV